MGELIRAIRDAGYNKLKSISPEFRHESGQCMINPNIISGEGDLKKSLPGRGHVHLRKDDSPVSLKW